MNALFALALALVAVVAAQSTALTTLFRSLNCPPSACENATTPPFWTSNGKVVRIDLAGLPGLNGTIDPVIGQLTELTDLRLQNLNIKGTVPTEIGLLTNLLVLFLNDNDLTGQLPDSVWSLSAMQYLIMSFNANLTGTISSAVGALTNLIQLRLDFTGMGGSVPWSALGALAQLQHLHLFSSRFSGTIGSEVGLLQSLEELKIQDNRFTSSLPTQLGRLNKLTILQALRNELDGPLLHLPTSVRTVNLDFNNFSGTVDVARLTSVVALTLGENKITALADSIGAATSLEALFVHKNSITGTLPTTLGNLRRLTDLRVGFNGFVGSLPPQLSNCVNLTRFQAARNMLTGTLPQLSEKLTNLDVNNNFLTGVADLTRFTRLVSLSAYSNCFDRVDVVTARGSRTFCFLDCVTTQAEGCSCATPKTCATLTTQTQTTATATATPAPGSTMTTGTSRTTTTSAAVTQTTPTSISDETRDAVNPALVGGVVGGAVALAAMVALFACRKKKRDSVGAAPTATGRSGSGSGSEYAIVSLAPREHELQVAPDYGNGRFEN
jgi:Leucine-rich repeat (LRR) protein